MPERSARVSRPITPVDLVRLRDIGVPDSTFFNMPSPLALSPDGREVAFVLSQADPVTNSYCRRLMVAAVEPDASPRTRSEEHTSELQSLMRISYAVFCLKKKKKIKNQT